MICGFSRLAPGSGKCDNGGERLGMLGSTPLFFFNEFSSYLGRGVLLFVYGRVLQLED
jgi:hypothetical protein